MRKNIYFLSLLVLLSGIGAMAQSTLQIVVGNGGIFNNSNDHVTLTSIDPENYNSNFIGEVIKESIQDLIVYENLAFVAAEDSLVKFDLETNTKLKAVFQPNLSRVYAKEDMLYVSLRSDLNGPPADGIYLKAFDLELNELYSTSSISMDAAGINQIGDSIYVAVPGDWQATEGHFAILTEDLSYCREENWGTSAVGIYDLISNGNMIYSINKSPYGATQGSVSVYHTETAIHTTYTLPNKVGKGVCIVNGLLYLGLDYGIGSYDINTHQIVDDEIIPDPGSASYINIAAAVFDEINEKFYITITDYFSMGQGIVYTKDGDELGNFDAMVSAEAMAVHYDYENYVQDQIPSGLYVFPNPSSDFIKISGLNDLQEVSVYNLNGQMMKQWVKPLELYNIKSLIPGNYLIKVKSENQINVIKLLKE